jgi:Fe-S cluster assembly iron-binding protein IscA
MPPAEGKVAMLILTDKATNVIRSIAERPEYPDTAGLRIAASSGGERLSAAPAENPEIGDQILDNGGARVFLDADAAERLDDQVLDAVVDDQNRVEFVLVGQQA